MNSLNPHRDRSPMAWIRSRLPVVLPALTACAIIIGCDGAPPAGDTDAPTDAADQPAGTDTAEMPLVSADALLYPDGAPIDAVYYPQYPENPLRARLQQAGPAAQ